VAGFLQAGALLAGEDAQKLGLVEAGLLPSFEEAISHLSDHDYVLAEPASHLVAGRLDTLIRAAWGSPSPTDAQVRWSRYRVEASVPTMRLYAAFLAGGEGGLRKLLADESVPLVAPGQP
jgi:hypothetical protein